MFDHCFSRNELQNRANWIFSVRYTIPKDTNRLLQLVWIRVIDVRISDFWPVVDAAETLLGNGNIVSQHTAHHAEADRGQEGALLQHRNGESRYEPDTMTRVVHSGALLQQAQALGPNNRGRTQAFGDEPRQKDLALPQLLNYARLHEASFNQEPETIATA